MFDPNKLKIGDILTYVHAEVPHVFRIVGLERYDKNSGKLAGKVFAANVLEAPGFATVQRIDRFYLERSGFATPMEVEAWKEWANKRLHDIIECAQIFSKSLARPIVNSRLDHETGENDYRNSQRHWTYRWTHDRPKVKGD